MLGAMAAVSLRERLALYLDLIRWDRPAGWLVLYWPTMGALWLAAAAATEVSAAPALAAAVDALRPIFGPRDPAPPDRADARRRPRSR